MVTWPVVATASRNTRQNSNVAARSIQKVSEEGDFGGHSLSDWVDIGGGELGGQGKSRSGDSDVGGGELGGQGKRG